MKNMFIDNNRSKWIGVILVLLAAAALVGCSVGSNVSGREKRPGAAAVIDGMPERISGTPSETPAPDETGKNSGSPVTGGTDKTPGNGSQINVGTKPDEAVKTPVTPKRVPILYYHAINDETFGIKELFVKPAMFEKQMEYLKQNNYTPIFFEQLEKLESIEKPIIISFDDGYEDNYSIMYPILKKFGYKAVIFPIIDMVGQPNYMTWEQMLSMRDLISFQNHTVTHRELIYLDRPAIEKEMSEATRQLEEKTGQKVSTVSYPIGLYNGIVKEAAKKYFKYGVTTDSGLYEQNGDRYQMPRIYVQRSDSLERFINMVKGLED